MRYLFLLCSLLILANVTQASSNIRTTSALTISKRAHYIKSLSYKKVQKLPLELPSELNFGHKQPIKKYLGDPLLSLNATVRSEYSYIVIEKECFNDLTDHPLHYFFLLFPQHYFW